MIQINSDHELLNSMMVDYRQQDKTFQADKFWDKYEKQNLKVLRDYGLEEFLNRPNSFGNRYTKKIIFPSLVARIITKLIALSRIPPILGRFGFNKHPFNIYFWVKENPSNIREAYGNFVFEILFSMENGHLLYELNDDLIGNPQEKIKIREKYYSLNFLHYFWRALIMDKYLNISKSNYFFEIGAGYGGQADVLLKMFPNLKICLTEIPPQLYVLEQYMKALYPNDVLGYKETKQLSCINRDTFENKRIVIVAPWEIYKMSNFTFDNFTNQASFQEMSHETVNRYCVELQRLIKNGICLYEQREGCGGVENPVTKNDYITYLNEFSLEKNITAMLGGHLDGDPRRDLAHQDIYFFKRKGNVLHRKDNP